MASSCLGAALCQRSPQPSTASSARGGSSRSLTDDEQLWHVLLGVLRRLRLPCDVAADHPHALTRPLADAGLLKLGERLRALNLLHRRRVDRPVPMVGAHSRCGVSPLAPGCIPRRLFTYWHSPHPPELVRCCVALMRRRNPGWEVRVLQPGCADLPAPPVPLDSIMESHQADWYRLAALAEYGGVYLDASCVTLQPLEEWVERGFRFVPDDDTMESWAIAAPCGCQFVQEWLKEFAYALRVGVKAYCQALPPEVVSVELQPSLLEGYLAIHAAWRAVRTRLPRTAFRLHASVELGRPYRYLAEQLWDSKLAVRELFRKSADELAHTPLIKLRGAERKEVLSLRNYGAISWLARTLVGSTHPLSVSERLSFLACGLELPD